MRNKLFVSLFVLCVLAVPAFSQPANPAPTPTQDQANVISLFSNAYTNVTVDTWSAVWDAADVADVQISGDDAKLYTNLTFAGIECTSSPIDASTMTHFHMDIWTSDPTDAGQVFKVKLVDAGADGVIGSGGDDSEQELTFSATSNPALVSGSWVSFDIPLVDFSGMTARAHIAQLIISGDPNTVYVDNVYFYASTASEPTTAAPTPTQDPADVISLFSNAYTNVTVDTWSADWPDMADVADVQIAGNDAKLYTNLTYAGIEFTSQMIDATGMNYFHMDIWTPDDVTTGEFKIKVVDFGADGTYGGGDDTEYELAYTTSTDPTLATGSWVSMDIPLVDFVGMNMGHLAQMILTANDAINTVYVDNVYFYAAAPTEPTVAAPTPTVDPADVISLFSNAYTNATVDTWSADWPDMADVADVQIAGNDTKLYTNITYAGIEFTSQTIDATGMNYFHMDIWTPDDVTTGSFKIKLVDFGDDGVYGNGDDTEYEVTYTATSDPALVTGTWVSLDIPLVDFAGMNTAHLAQMILTCNDAINTVYVDNVYFYNSGTVIVVPEPTGPAPTPTVDPASVQSIYSDAYTSTDFDSWDSQYDDSSVEDYLIGDDHVKKYNVGSFTIAEYDPSVTGTMDISGMTHVHFDIWTPHAVVATDSFKVKLVDYGDNGVWDANGDDTEYELRFDASTTPPLTGESWISFDIPLSEFSGITGRQHFAQFIMATNVGIVYIDNLYFYTDGSNSAPETAEMPSTFEIRSIYPNPFNPTTSIEIALPQMADIQMAVYNSLGQKVSTLASGRMSAGVHTLTFDGSQLSSGLYYVVARVNGLPVGSRKMMLIK